VGIFEYDVAFSFLDRDEPIALQLNDRLQDRVKTFVYTEQQKVVAGTDGEQTFNRVFGKEARVVVVLYREGWGETPWTRIEQTAIRNRGHDEGYDFAKFIPLDEPPTVPRWLPKTQLWIGFRRFGIEGAAAVIEARVQEAGGEVHQETVEEHAQRVERKIVFDKRRADFQREPGVQAAKQQFAELKRALELCAASVKMSTSIPLQVGELQGGYWVIGLGRALFLVWLQRFLNTLEESDLEVRLYSHLPPNPAQQWMFEKPSILKQFHFEFDLLPSEVGGWVVRDGPRRTFSTQALAEHLIKFYLEHGRDN
jgi:hypothetical protein